MPLPDSLRRHLWLLFCASLICSRLLSNSALTSTSSRTSSVTPPPLVASLLFGWLSQFMTPQPLPLVAPLPGTSAPAIHHASNFHHATLIWLVAALPGTSLPPLTVTFPVAASWCTPSFVCFVALSSALAFYMNGCCVASCHVAASCGASMPLDCDSAQRRLPTATIPSAASAPHLPQGVALTRKQVQVEIMQCSGNTTGVGRPKEPVVTKLTKN